MLAAGNRVIIKPSDYTPACGALLPRNGAAGTFGEDQCRCRSAASPLAREFPTPGAGITCSTPAARPSAARSPSPRRGTWSRSPWNLVASARPSWHPDSVDAASVRSVVGTKLVKNGHQCISVDYVLVPRSQLDDFVSHAERYVTEELPDYASSPADCTGIITLRHFDRIVAMAERGAGQRRPGGRAGRRGDLLPRDGCRCLLVIDPAQELRIMPRGSVRPHSASYRLRGPGRCRGRVNAGERPLGLYVYSKDQRVAADVLRRTTSGGACVNVCAAPGRAAVPRLWRHRAERHWPPPRHRRVPRVLQPARCRRPRDRRPGRCVPAALRGPPRRPS